MNARPLAIGAAAIGSGLLGGVLFAFSSFVMPGLRRIPAPEGIGAMQSINRQATTFAFGALIVATGVLALGVGVQTLLHRDQPGAGWIGVGSVSIVLAFAITGAYNIPRNDRLASFDASSPAADEYWTSFLREWIMANHLRTLCCVITAGAYTAALRSASR